MKPFDRQISQVNKKLEKPRKKPNRAKVNWKHSDWMEAFTPIKRRIDMQHMLQYLSAGLLSAMGVILLVIGLSFFIPIENLWQYFLIFGLSTLFFALTAGWIRRPTVYEAARIIDKFGLDEKVLTACELDERDDPMADIQRADAVNTLSRFDRKRISLQISKSHGIVFLALILVFMLTNLISNPMEPLIQEKKILRAEIEEQLEGLKNTEKELAAKGTLTEEQLQEFAKQVEELAVQLKKTGDFKKALKEISKAEDGLSALTDKIREEGIGQLTEQLDSLEETQALAQALSNRNSADFEKALEQLKEQLEQAEKKEELAESLQEALERAIESMPDGEVRKSLVSASDSLSSGKAGAAAEQLGEAMKQAINASNSMSDANYALQQMRSSIARAAEGSQYAQGSEDSERKIPNNDKQGNENQNGGDSGKNNSESNQSSGEGQGRGTGEGQGIGQGEGIGEGQGQDNNGTGSGAGSGTTNQSTGQGGSGTTGRNGNDPQGIENAQSAYEQIYAPERLGDGGDITHISGQNTEQGDITSEDGGRGAGNLAGYIPYREVYQEYRNEAMNSMDRRVLPLNVQDMVRKYFDALGD